MTSFVGHGKGGGKSAVEMDAEDRERELGRVITVRCCGCDWFCETGRQDVVRPLWARHRRVVHADRKAEALIERALARVGTKRRPTIHGKTSWSKQRVLDGIQGYVDAHGRVPTYNSSPALAQHGRRLFGTWGAALAEAGFEPAQQGHRTEAA